MLFGLLAFESRKILTVNWVKGNIVIVLNINIVLLRIITMLPFMYMCTLYKAYMHCMYVST